MEVDVLYFKVTDKVVVYPGKIDFVNGTTFPHEFTTDGTRYRLTKFKHDEKHFLIACSDHVDKEEISAAIEEFKPAQLY